MYLCSRKIELNIPESSLKIFFLKAGKLPLTPPSGHFMPYEQSTIDDKAKQHQTLEARGSNLGLTILFFGENRDFLLEIDKYPRF